MQSVALDTDVCNGTADKLFGYDVASGQSGSSFWTVDAAGDHWGESTRGGLESGMTPPCALASLTRSRSLCCDEELGGGVLRAVWGKHRAGQALHQKQWGSCQVRQAAILLASRMLH